MNGLYGNYVNDDPCLGAIFSRAVGNPLYAAIISEPKGRVSEVLRLLTENQHGKGSFTSNLIITGINVSDKAFGGWLWVKGSKLLDIQGRCPDEDPELAALLENVVVQEIPRESTEEYARILEETQGAIFGERDDILLHGSVPTETIEFFDDNPFGTEELE